MASFRLEWRRFELTRRGINPLLNRVVVPLPLMLVPKPLLAPLLQALRKQLFVQHVLAQAFPFPKDERRSQYENPGGHDSKSNPTEHEYRHAGTRGQAGRTIVVALPQDSTAMGAPNRLPCKDTAHAPLLYSRLMDLGRNNTCQQRARAACQMTLSHTLSHTSSNGRLGFFLPETKWKTKC